jgi:arsenate reductase-like glutaredoxin family protein
MTSANVDVTIYTSASCKGSKKALEKLQKKGINFQVINITNNSGMEALSV